MIEPYYQDSAVTLYHGDCRDILPTLGMVDHVITDPPYEAEAHTKYRTTRAVLEGRMSDASIDFAAITEEVRSFLAAQASRLARAWVLVFCQVEGVNPWRDAMVAAGLKWRRAQIWVKPDSAPQFTGDRPAQGFEAIATAWAGDGKSVWNGGGKRGVYEHMVGVAGGLRNEHPTQKPESLMCELLGLFTDEGDLILDPFGGSGTTAVAAKRLGRRCILIEKEEKYCEVAAQRLQQSALDLFGARPEPVTMPLELTPDETVGR